MDISGKKTNVKIMNMIILIVKALNLPLHANRLLSSPSTISKLLISIFAISLFRINDINGVNSVTFKHYPIVITICRLSI